MNCIKKLQKHRWEKDFSELTARLNSTTDNTEKQKIKLQINELIKAQPK